MFKKKEKSIDKIASLPVDYQILQSTVQDFLPFEDIQDSMICLPNAKYRMVAEISSINYYLKTAEEQENIEVMFKAALTSWDFPFAFYVQTRSLDAEEIQRNLTDDVDKIADGPLKRYGREYTREMYKMNKGSNGTLIKKNYIIVECNDAGLISANQTEEDKRKYAYDRLRMNIRKVAEGLAPLGINARMLYNDELAELLFVAINKHSAFKANDLINHFSDTVYPAQEWNIPTVEQMFEGFETSLNKLLENSYDISSSEIEKARDILQKVKDIRKETVQDGNIYFDL